MKEEILAFDARRITNSMRKGVLKILKSKGSSFDHATIKRVSRAAAPLAAWVKANIQYVARRLRAMLDEWVCPDATSLAPLPSAGTRWCWSASNRWSRSWRKPQTTWTAPRTSSTSFR